MIIRWISLVPSKIVKISALATVYAEPGGLIAGRTGTDDVLAPAGQSRQPGRDAMSAVTAPLTSGAEHMN
jgi:hypothetical protein